MLRSGPFARVRHRVRRRRGGDPGAPRPLAPRLPQTRPRAGAWTIGEDARATPLQAYRRALSKVELAAGNNAFVASHGGAALLEYHPRYFKDFGITIPDLEVARLTTSTDDGHPRLTLGLRSAGRGPARPIARPSRSSSRSTTRSWSARSTTNCPDRSSSRIAASSTTIRTAAPSFARTSRRSRVRSGPSDWTWRNAGSGRSPRPSSPSNRSWPASSPAGSSGSRSMDLDRDAPRLVLAGVRRRRDQPGRWVRPGPGRPPPRPAGPAGGLKVGMAAERPEGIPSQGAGTRSRRGCDVGRGKAPEREGEISDGSRRAGHAPGISTGRIPAPSRCYLRGLTTHRG